MALSHWKVDADLAGVRDPGSLATLPEGERAEWRALWAEVDALLGQVRAARGKPAVSRAGELPADPFAR